MFCCKGNKAPSKPVAQDAVARTLLADKRGAAASKAILPMKEPPVDRNIDVVATVKEAEGEKQPDFSAEQNASQEVEESSGTHPISRETDYAHAVKTDTASSGTHSTGLLRKQRTVVVDKNELDVMVVEYSCHDSSVLTALGKHSKEAKWKVQVGYDTAPVDITLHVDKGVMSGPAVQVSSNNQTVFQTAGGYTRRNMYDDFEHRWPFRGTIKGMNEPGVFELRPHALAAADEWFPATITGQRSDGFLEVVAMMPDNFGGFKQVSYPSVHKADLREASTRKQLQIPERCLILQVPRDDPLQACLSLDKSDLVTHHFARPSPSPTFDDHAPKKQLELHVARDRSTVTGNVGHAMLSHFVSGEVQAVSSDVKRLQHSWTIQVGPFAEHTIVVEKKHSLSKVLTLSIDGQPFVEACAEDIDCYTGGWECNFRFVGERVIDFEVHESNRDGVTLDSKDHVLQKTKYVHECCVAVGDDMDMRTATLTVDSQDFRELPVHTEPHNQEHISISPEALNLTYGILVPYKVNHTAPCGFLGGLTAAQGGASKTVRRVRNICC